MVSLIQIFMRERILMEEEYITSIYRLEKEFKRQIALIQNVGKQRMYNFVTNYSTFID